MYSKISLCKHFFKGRVDRKKYFIVRESCLLNLPLLTLKYINVKNPAELKICFKM